MPKKAKIDLSKIDIKKVNALIDGRKYKILPVSHIMPNPYNKNKMGELYFHALKANLANEKIGFTIPILVRPNPNRDSPTPFMIIDGEHRWRAAKDLEYEKVPCIVFPPMKEDLAQFLMLESNAVHGDTSDEDKKLVLSRILEIGETFEEAEDIFALTITDEPVVDSDKYNLDDDDDFMDGKKDTTLVSLYFTPEQTDYFKRIVGQYRLSHGVTAEEAVFDMVAHFAQTTGFGELTGDAVLDKKQSDLIPNYNE